MKGIANIYPNDIECGIAKIRHFNIDKTTSEITRLRAIFNSRYDEYISPGNYVKLIIGGELYMSDTDMEQNSNREFCKKANGNIMIAGLGIGLIIENIRDKVISGEIKHITVYEKYQDVITLVSPYFKDLPITYKCADILEYKPAKDEIYDVIYFDIWPFATTDNLPEMAKLHNRWKFHLNRENTKCWMGSWKQKWLQKIDRY